MSAPRLCAVVPVKPFALAKGRLAPLLGPAARAGLARAMLRDVLDALRASPGLAAVFVLTDDAEAAALAEAAGAAVLPEGSPRGLAAAVTGAARTLAAAGREGILVVPADVPRIAPEDVARITRAHRPAPAVTLVAAARDGGTNALAASPPDAIGFSYGEDSFHRHTQAARSAGIAPAILRLPRLETDIDGTADLLRLVAGPLPVHTEAFLEAAGLLPGLREAARSWRPAAS